jgi:hypothetical protein
MPPRKLDKFGNPFRKGWAYDLYGHKLELLEFKEYNTRAEFVITEDYGALRKGKRLNLQLNEDFVPLGLGKSFIKTNKDASSLLEQEW